MNSTLLIIHLVYLFPLYEHRYSNIQLHPFGCNWWHSNSYWSINHKNISNSSWWLFFNVWIKFYYLPKKKKKNPLKFCLLKQENPIPPPHQPLSKKWLSHKYTNKTDYQIVNFRHITFVKKVSRIFIYQHE